MPARFRGRTDLAINGSFWLGAALGAFGAVTFLQPGRLPPDLGWRVAFGIGAALGLGMLLLRRHIPESPRWLMLHDRLPEAERVIGEIERRVGERAAGIRRSRKPNRSASPSPRARRWHGWRWRSCATIRSAPFSASC